MLEQLIAVIWRVSDNEIIPLYWIINYVNDEVLELRVDTIVNTTGLLDY